MPRGCGIRRRVAHRGIRTRRAVPRLDGMVTRVDTLVVGGGAMGSSAAWKLARRGRDVTLLERFEPGHLLGASHGASRNFNVAYAHPTYVAMLVEALPLWRELEAEAHTPLLDQVGVVNHGPRAAFDGVQAALTAAGIPASSCRWPRRASGGRASASTPGCCSTAGGAGERGCHGAGAPVAAAAFGADVRHRRARRASGRRRRARARGIRHRRRHDGVFEARTAVVTLGAWTSKLLGGVRAPAAARRDAGAAGALRRARRRDHVARLQPLPGRGRRLVRYWRSPVYGMLTPGEGVKAGWHGVGPVVDPDLRDFAAEPEQFAALRRYAREWLPGVDADAGDPHQLHVHDDARLGLRARRVGPDHRGRRVLGARLQVHARRRPHPRRPRRRLGPRARAVRRRPHDRGSAGVADRPRRLSRFTTDPLRDWSVARLIRCATDPLHSAGTVHVAPDRHGPRCTEPAQHPLLACGQVAGTMERGGPGRGNPVPGTRQDWPWE